jgi:D-amino-acid dehydrogenase
VEIIGGQDLFELEPALSRDCHSAVIIKDQARALHPGDLTKALAGKAQRLGAKFIQAEARQLRPDRKGGYQLEAQGQTIACNRLVLAGGIWSADLLKCLGIKLPMIAERGYHAEFRNPGVTLNNSVMDVAGKFVISSMTNGIRVAGTSEFAHRDAPPNHERSAILERQARSLLPDLTSEKADHWMGVRPSLPDNLPLIGPLPGHPNLIAAFGHSHYGMGMAPATGRIVAGLISGDRDNQHLGAISPARMV